MIVLACTFRSFGQGINDYNQRTFIDSLRKSILPIHLVVTQFGEIGIEQELSGLSYTLLDSNPPWSLSQVFINARNLYPTANIVWTNADLIFEPFFFAHLENALENFDYVTSWPHLLSKRSFSPQISSEVNFSGLDLLGISSRISKRVAEFAEQFPNLSWGLFEHQIVSYAYLASNRRRGLNLFKKSHIVKLLTSHENLNEPNYYLRKTWRENLKRWDWIKHNRFRRLWLDFSWVMLKFKNTPLRFTFVLIYLFYKNKLQKLTYAKLKLRQ